MRDSLMPFFANSGLSLSPSSTFGASGPPRSIRSSSPFWNASRRAWSSSMMLTSMRPTCGIFLPFISRDQLLVGGVVRLEVPREAAVIGIGFEHDLRAAHPLLEPVRAGADRVGHRAAALVAIRLDHFARDGRRRLVREDVRQVVVGVLEPDAQRVAVGRLESRDLRVVVELAGLLRRLGKLVEADDLAFDEPRPRRAELRVDQALQRIRVIGRRSARACLPLNTGSSMK